jgi:N-alpha-acetyl-L-2,4-diaminobutyrate deacetylase
MSSKTQVATDIGYEKSGKQQGYLRTPYSHNNAAWANLLIPITVVKSGEGPTLLALGGTHGDEYEGPVALMKLARDLRPEEIHGRVIIIPALNLPAVRAGTRLSPIDGVNLNRAFPGKYNGSITEMIAHYVTTVLFPLADVVMDIHSGGRSLVFVPCATLHRVPNESQFQQMLAAAKVWGTQYVFIYSDVAGEGLLPSEAENAGKIVVTTEMGGAGQCSPEALRITQKGIRNVMIQQGLMEGLLDPPANDPQVVAATRREDYHLAPADGIYESFVEVGNEVKEGEPLGQIHFPERGDRLPEVVIAQTSGILIGRRFPARTNQGECIATVARPIEA